MRLSVHADFLKFLVFSISLNLLRDMAVVGVDFPIVFIGVLGFPVVFIGGMDFSVIPGLFGIPEFPFSILGIVSGS